MAQVGLCHGIVKPGTGVFSAPLALSRADRHRNCRDRRLNKEWKNLEFTNSCRALGCRAKGCGPS